MKLLATQVNLEKAALRGEPSYVWRAGQERRLELLLDEVGGDQRDRWLENGCGIGVYLERLAPYVKSIVGLEYELERAIQALQRNRSQANVHLLSAAGERLPFPGDCFDVILSHEVLEHVGDDRLYIQEAVRTLRPGGRLLLFCPNRGYPFETHGVFWRGRYHFGNIPLVNYLPRRLRDRLAPHVRAYTQGDLDKLFSGLPVRYIRRSVLFGAYDNIIARAPRLGRTLRWFLQRLERTPLQVFGLSHFWVVEKHEPSSHP